MKGSADHFYTKLGTISWGWGTQGRWKHMNELTILLMLQINFLYKAEPQQNIQTQ